MRGPVPTAVFKGRGGAFTGVGSARSGWRGILPTHGLSSVSTRGCCPRTGGGGSGVGLPAVFQGITGGALTGIALAGGVIDDADDCPPTERSSLKGGGALYAKSV